MFTNLRDNPVFWMLMRRSFRPNRLLVYVGWILLYSMLVGAPWFGHLLQPFLGTLIDGLIMCGYLGYSIVFSIAVEHSVKTWKTLLSDGLLEELRTTPISGHNVVLGLRTWLRLLIISIMTVSICLLLLLQAVLSLTGVIEVQNVDVWLLFLVLGASQLACGLGISALSIRFAMGRPWIRGSFHDGLVYSLWCSAIIVTGLLLHAVVFVAFEELIGRNSWTVLLTLIIPAVIHLLVGHQALIHAAQSYDREDWVAKV